jgi:methyl-accepting chemotaxis protein
MLLTLVSIPGTMIIFYIYHRITKKLQYMIDTNDRSEKSVKFAKQFPYTASILFCAPLLTASITISVVTYIQKILITPYQMIFYILLDIILAISLTMYHYYRFKIILHPVSSANNLKSLAVFEKLMAPILSFMMVVLIFVGVGIYTINVNRTIEFYRKTTESETEKISVKLDSAFNSIVIELGSYLNSINPDTLSQGPAIPLMQGIFSKKINKNIETVFVSKSNGDSYTTVPKVINLSDRPYFKEMTASRSAAWSSGLVTSRDTGNKVIACVVPKIIAGRFAGSLGATINTEGIQTIVNESSRGDGTKYMLVNGDGKIIYHPDSRFIDKVLGTDLTDKNGHDLKIFLSNPDEKFHHYIIDNTPLLLRQVKLNSTGHSLVSISYEKHFMKPVNDIIVRVVVAVIFINIVVFLIIFKTGKSFSDPIKNTISIFRDLAAGDLTARSSDYLHDEFGDMIRNMKVFQDKIRDVVEQAMNSAAQLAASAEELAATSSSLAEGAQSQAAAIEEATASLEEIAASNDMIADNSRLQSDHSKTTNKTMAELGSFIISVNNDALSALKVANVTTTEATKGGELMQNTIKGINSIEEN